MSLISPKNKSNLTQQQQEICKKIFHFFREKKKNTGGVSASAAAARAHPFSALGAVPVRERALPTCFLRRRSSRLNAVPKSGVLKFDYFFRWNNFPVSLRFPIQRFR